MDDILVLVHSKQAGKRAHSFLCSFLVRLGLHINFSKSDLCLAQTLCFLGLCLDTVCMSVSLPLDKLADIQQLVLSLLQSQHVTVNGAVSFLGKANFCTNGQSQLQHLCRVIQSDMLCSSPQYQVNSSPIVCVVLTLDSWNYCSREQALQPNIFLSMFALHGFID